MRQYTAHFRADCLMDVGCPGAHGVLAPTRTAGQAMVGNTDYIRWRGRLEPWPAARVRT